MPANVLTELAREKSAYSIKITFKDENGLALTPDTATWTLTDRLGAVVNSRSQVSIVSPSSTETIVLQGNDLAILAGEKREKRIFTVEGTYSGGRPLKEQVEFWVENLTAII